MFGWIDRNTAVCRYMRKQPRQTTLRPLIEVYRLKYNSDTESVIKLEIAKTTQIGTKRFECESDIIFTRELQVMSLSIYVNVSHN